MHKMIALALVAGLAGCSDKAFDALERYELVKKHGTTVEVCGAAENVRDAYLEQGNEERYRFWHVQSALDCNAATLESLR